MHKRDPSVLPKTLSLIIFDFDGVFTDNKVYVFEDGREAVQCNRGDGLGINKLLKNELNVFVLSTETNEVVKRRCEKLQLQSHTACKNKAEFLQEYCARMNYPLQNVIYVGNDTNDLEAMNLVGCPVCPEDAYPEIKDIAKFHLARKGGEGAVRELCELVLSHCHKVIP